MRFWSRTVAASFCGACMVLGAAPAASAHATLEQTTPQQGSEVATAPASVSLRFSEAVGIGVRAIQVLDPRGRRVDQGEPHHPSGDGSSVAVDLDPGLPAASYTVVWHVASADSHPISGTFVFGVGVPAGAASAQARTDPVVGMLDAAFRAAAYVGAVLLVGGLFFLVVLWRGGLRRSRPRRIVRLGLVTSAAAAAGLFLLQGPYGASLGPASALDPQVMLDTLGSRYGKLMLLRLVVLGFAGYVLRGFDAHADADAAPRRLGGDLAVPGVLFLASFSLAEHAGQGSLVVLSATADATHLTAACVWIGGLAVLGVALLERPGANGRPGSVDRARERELSAVLPRWSRTAMIAVTALVITGTYQAWREIGTLPALTGTTYGRLVIAKVSCLVVLLVLGNEGRRWINRRFGGPLRVAVPEAAVVGAPPPAQPELAPKAPTPTSRLPAPGDGGEPVEPGLGRLRRTVVAEVAVGAVVIGLTTALVDTVPGRQSYAPPFSATVTGQGNNGEAITELLTVDRTKAGPTTVHVYTYTKAGVVLPFASASATLVERGKGLGPVRFTLTPLAPGHASAANVIVPSPGRWTLTTQVMTDATTDYAATATYTVR
jgi:copper transport protein